jgi:hypothetical protein
MRWRGTAETEGVELGKSSNEKVSRLRYLVRGVHHDAPRLRLAPTPGHNASQYATKIIRYVKDGGPKPNMG